MAADPECYRNESCRAISDARHGGRGSSRLTEMRSQMVTKRFVRLGGHDRPINLILSFLNGGLFSGIRFSDVTIKR
jgi:hypothetical protein